MNIVKVNPFLQGKSLTSIIDDVFNRSISDLVGSDLSVTTPSVNISENDDSFTMEIAAPGLNKSDFKIAIEKDQLVVSSEKSSDSAQVEEGKWTRKEFNYASFKRSFHLSDSVDAEKIQATYENGILILTLPKKEEKKSKGPKTIEIK